MTELESAKNVLDHLRFSYHIDTRLLQECLLNQNFKEFWSVARRIKKTEKFNLILGEYTAGKIYNSNSNFLSYINREAREFGFARNSRDRVFYCQGYRHGCDDRFHKFWLKGNLLTWRSLRYL
jgi:hypothetical protein